MSLTIYNFNGTPISQQPEDGYMDATAMCQANGKKFYDYSRLGATQEFLSELSSVTGIPATDLVRSVQGGDAKLQGTWVHPLVANNLGQWCSPAFAVFVAVLVHEWRKAGQPDFRQSQSQPIDDFDRQHKASLQKMKTATKQTLAEVKRLEKELEIKKLELELERLKLGKQQPTEQPTPAEPTQPEPAEASSPRRRLVVELQREVVEKPLRESYQRMLAVLSPYEALDAVEVAELAGTTPAYARASLVEMWREKLVHRTLANPGKSSRLVYYKVETAR